MIASSGARFCRAELIAGARDPLQGPEYSCQLIKVPVGLGIGSGSSILPKRSS
jgi:hypothetical protein